ncbi:UNVERIFIED_CONTAM: MATE family efflux transporter [Halobacillus marinus]|uniref:MATE family efflux transporter n=1 Tax=Halobacillus sp. BAB-2008 TaxID=1246484 RepID=UPI0002A5178C|nr:MATE family efflux transporter [Halobacillus sp. BAB-2008]ELK47944.1 MATE efflux family protein [Halobacillus sp. BAB-2008]
MTHEKDVKKLTLFTLTWPIFIEVLLHMLMGNADTLMLSQYSDEAVAAVGVANQILSVIIVMFGFIATGAAILVAQNLGAGKPKEAGAISVTSLSVNLWFSLLLSFGLFLFSEPILAVMDLPAQLMGEAVDYMNIVGGLIFVQALLMTAGAILRSYGHTKDTMYVTIGMNIVNVIGNYIVIFGPFGLPVYGVQGVAVSTAVSRGLGFIVLFLLLVKRVSGSLPWTALYRYEIKHIKSLLNIGIPSAGEQLSYNASQMVITYFVAQMGATALTTKVYAQNLMMFIFLFSVAIGQGTQILIGHHIGAKETEQAYRQCMRSLKLAIAVSIVVAVVFYFSSDILLGLFTDDPLIIASGGTLLLLSILLEPGRAFNLVVINSLRAAGDVRYPVVIGILSMWGVQVTIAWLLGLPLSYGLIGIWIAFIVDEWLRGLLMLRRWRGRTWYKKSFVHQNNHDTELKKKNHA